MGTWGISSKKWKLKESYKKSYKDKQKIYQKKQREREKGSVFNREHRTQHLRAKKQYITIYHMCNQNSKQRSRRTEAEKNRRNEKKKNKLNPK